MSAKAVILESDDIDPKGLVDRLFTDSDYLGVPVIYKEDCDFITDRWGDTDPDDSSLAPATLAAVQQLRPFMRDEMTFIVQRGSSIGLLFEWEYMNPETEPEDAKENWNRDLSLREAILELINRAQPMQEAVPKAQVYLSLGEHNFNGRIAVRAFIANPTEAECVAIANGMKL